MRAVGIDIGGTSVKAAGVIDGEVVWTGASAPYARPSLNELSAASVAAIGGRACDVDRIGLCVPGLLDGARRRITLSVNVPALNGLDLNELVAGWCAGN